MTLTLCTTTDIIRKAGLGANSTITASGTWLEEIGNNAEGCVIADTRIDWITGYSDVNTYVKLKLQEATAAKAALDVVTYSSKDYSARLEQETLIDKLYDEYAQAIQVLSRTDANNIKQVGE